MPFSLLPRWLQKTCSSLNMHTPTPIQIAAIPAILEGKAVVGGAPTGTGKTAAFALPIISKLSDDPYGVFAVVIEPVRELVLQVAEQFRTLGSPLSLRVEAVIGGEHLVNQHERLRRRPHVVVCTPGRLNCIFHADQEFYTKAFRNARFLVFDEADRLTEDTFKSDLEGIISTLPASIQTLWFSATISDDVKSWHERLGGAVPVLMDLNADCKPAETLQHLFLCVPPEFRLTHLVRLMENHMLFNGVVVKQNRSWDGDGANQNDDEEEESEILTSSGIIFCAMCETVARLARALEYLGFAVSALHSGVPQRERTASLNSFRSEKTRILLATDLASRGLDIPMVNWVANYDTSADVENYVHRAGRAGRAGRKGTVLTFVSGKRDVSNVNSIEAKTGVTMQAVPDYEEEHGLEDMNRVTKAEASASIAHQVFDKERIVSRKRNRQFTKNQNKRRRELS
ncbi:MAG: hypothetical protein KVP17_004711 [Porospora cf. gigantea B]|uniref:uncharacterized protein n=2 Tax=Porospora cf. gigantea B TaxID=2853592 RepID=UPI003571AB0B|nr:MAG: hypothetical protein KVP17_004711 [Porospora cf. gigantea B]